MLKAHPPGVLKSTPCRLATKATARQFQKMDGGQKAHEQKLPVQKTLLMEIARRTPRIKRLSISSLGCSLMQFQRIR